MTLRLSDLAESVNGRVRGDKNLVITSVATLERAGPGDITYVAETKYIPLLEETNAAAVILTEKVAEAYAGNALIVDNPRLSYTLIAQQLYPTPQSSYGIHSTAIIDKSAKISTQSTIGENVVIGPNAVISDKVCVGANCTIGQHVVIGDATIIYPHVNLYAGTKIGRHCIIHSGAVIGSDGFGYSKNDGSWEKIPQLGCAIIGDNVEIGANTTIDRGALEDTIIGDGVKLDNLIQIAHNVRIGENTAIAACTGIAGSTRIGKRCSIGGQVAVLGHLSICDDVFITVDSMVSSSINEPGKYSSSIPATESRGWNKNLARIFQLDKLIRKLQNK